MVTEHSPSSCRPAGLGARPTETPWSAFASAGAHLGEPRVARSDPVSVRLLPAEEVGAVGRRWRTLEKRIDGGLACSWDWTEAWLDQFGADTPHWFALGERGDRDCAIALVTESTVRRGPLRTRRLHLGTAGEP